MKIEDFDQIKNNVNFYQGINGSEEYLKSVVLLLLVSNDYEYHLVFEKRTPNIRQADEICFLGGKIDMSDKILEDTAIRETRGRL